MKFLLTLLALKNNFGIKKYFFNTSWLFAEQGLRILTSLLVGVWVARYLGPESFGIFSYALAFTAVFAGVAKLGLDGIMVRELLDYPEKRDTYLGTAFWLKIIGALIVMGLIAAIVPFTSNDATTNLFIFIIAAGLVFQSFEVIDFYFQSQVLAKIVSICKVIQLALSSIIKMYLVLTGAELIWFVLVAAFDALSLAVSYYIAYQLRKTTNFYNHFDLSIAKQLLKDSWPLIFSSIVVMIYMRIDQIMIKEMLGEYEVGIYSAAVRLSEAFYFIPILINASLFPAILNAKRQSEELYLKRVQRLYTFMVWMAIIIALPMTFLSDWLTQLLFGEAYQKAGQVLMIHIWAGVFVFMGVASGNWFIVENEQMLSFWRTFSGMVVNIVLNFFLIPKYGLEGAAFATLFSQFTAAYLFDMFNKRTRQMFFLKTRAFVSFGSIFKK
jgi:O-antigen/teichoic acid export membrane protein